MSTLHVTNGDHAAAILLDALSLAGRAERVIALKDDLAVGPLKGIDDTPSPDTRAVFWQHVIDVPGLDLAAEIREQDALFAQLARDDSQVVVWHAQSASDQLTLRRVAYHLRNTPQRLNEAKLTERDLSAEGDTAGPRGRNDGATAVGMFTAAELLAKLPTAAPISVLRISRLALEWQEAKQANGETRRWRDNTFVSGVYAEIDEAIVHLATAEWQPARKLAGRIMAGSFGFMVSDAVAFWRCRELVAAGRLAARGALSGAATGLLDGELRRPSP